ncbi:endothelial cell adhesion molecule a [Trematomus bernacchii]|uniref:endothelial cell adhesion molecule a n=1 Tax=Trematomus bernacchii TaxID=40690 RepID=UPI00146A25BF|nr:endothelial cell adhesion molecule a [Trematomus bernacchii]
MELSNTSRKLPLLALTFLWALSGVWAMIQMPQSSMEVIQGQMVVLRAVYSRVPGSDLSLNTIIWNFQTPEITQLIISYTKGSISVGSPQFKGRVGFSSSMPSENLSLYINDTQESDSGRYVCQVIIPSDPGSTAQLTLDVKVPPAVPKCSVSGKPVLKGNVTLSCSSSSGKPLPLYRWKKTSPTSQVFFSPMLNEKTGTLKLSNLNSNMSGKYECSASNSAGSESCSINLDIVTSTNVGMIVGATVGSVVGFILLLLICLFFLVKRRRDNEDDMANEIKEDAQAPKRVSWAKSGMGSDIISKNGTLSSIGSSPHHQEPPHHHNNHHHLQQYPQRPPSDTASIITATGSMAGYRPSRHHGASTPTPTHYSYNNNSTLPRGGALPSEASTNGSSLPRPERYGQLPQAQVLPQTYSQPQHLQAAPGPPPLPTSTVTASNIARMGGVPIMVPAQNQAGSLV